MAYDIPAVATTMDQKILQLNHITHNLANAATPGYKAQHLYALKSLEQAIEADETTASANTIFTDFSQGLTEKTGNPLDLTLRGDGFFAVQTPEGEAYTRQGSFTVNRLNQIVTQAGNIVLGEGGPITLKSGNVHIGEDGSVFVDASQMGKLKTVDFTNKQALTDLGGGLYRDSGSAGQKKVEKPSIASGAIELSNVNIIKEMAEMIDIHRSFETYQKIIQTMSEEDKLSTGRVGRLG